MIICGVDVETSGLDASAEVVEVGVVLYDTVVGRVINSFGKILPVKTWSVDAAKVHKISYEYSYAASGVYCNLYELLDIRHAEYIVAHNAEFDKPKILSICPDFNDKTWLDTVHDINHDEHLGRSYGSKKLTHLAVEYGIPVMGGHRAVVDATYCCQIASAHDLNKALINKNSTKYQLSIGGEYNEKYVEYVKSLNFKFDGQTRLWVKKWLQKDEFMQWLEALSEDLPQWQITHSKMPKNEY